VIEREVSKEAAKSLEQAQALIEEIKSENELNNRLFVAACADLGLINERLGLDPDDGGADPILDAISALEAQNKALAEALRRSTSTLERTLKRDGIVFISDVITQNRAALAQYEGEKQ